MKVLVTGGRHFRNRNWLWAGLDRLYTLHPITMLIEGGAEGADRYASEWVAWTNQSAGFGLIQHITVPAEWAQFGRSAGHIRNAKMADLGPDVVLAAPGGKGTANMIETARKRGIQVVLLEKMDIALPTGSDGTVRTNPEPTSDPARSHGRWRG